MKVTSAATMVAYKEAIMRRNKLWIAIFLSVVVFYPAVALAAGESGAGKESVSPGDDASTKRVGNARLPLFVSKNLDTPMMRLGGATRGNGASLRR